MPTEQHHRCECGAELWQWRYTTVAGKTTGIWCASLADLISYQNGKAPRHDVCNLQGRRIQWGTCAAAPLTPEVA
jgi:hypothetical protein